MIHFINQAGLFLVPSCMRCGTIFSIAQRLTCDDRYRKTATDIRGGSATVMSLIMQLRLNADEEQHFASHLSDVSR